MLLTSADPDSAGSNRCHARPEVARLRRARRAWLPAVRPDRRTNDVAFGEIEIGTEVGDNVLGVVGDALALVMIDDGNDVAVGV